MKLFDELLNRYGRIMNRFNSWQVAAKAAKDLGCKRFVETGCYRGVEADGFSTLLLASLASVLNGKLDSYELNPNHISAAKQALEKHGLGRYANFHQGDSVSGLALRKEQIDFAYLDSCDCGPGPDYSVPQEHQLAECEAVLPLLSKRSAVMLDDNVISGGKTVLTMKRLEMRGFKNLATDYQVLYTTENGGFSTKKIGYAVLTGHQEVYVPMAVQTIYRNKAQYALSHGYDLRVIRSTRPEFVDANAHAGGFSWSRMAEMLDLVESGMYEWVWCVGADTLITNFTFTLKELTRDAPTASHLLICGERVAPIQADSFLVRSSKEGANYLRDILGARTEYARHPWVENQAMIDRRHKHQSITKIVPQHRMNSYDYSQFYHIGDQYRSGQDCYGNRGQWIKGDFLIHWAGISMSERLKLMTKYEGLIEK